MPIIDGKVVRARYTSLKLDEISSVDSPAQPGATASILKRHTPPTDTPEPSLLGLAVTKYISTDDGAHTFDEVLRENKFSEAIWPMTDALSQSIRSIMGDKDLSSSGRESKITTTVEEFLTAVRSVSPDVEKQLWKLISKKEDNAMPKTVEELESEITKLSGQVNALTAERDSAVTAKAAADEARVKAEDEAKEAKKALVEATDETISVGDQEIRKSAVGDAQFSVMKAMREERDSARFEKRAAEEFPHLPGTETEKALVLKHVERLPEEAKKAAEAILTSAEKMAKGGFARLGVTGEQSPTSKAAVSTFNEKVSEIQKRDNVNRATAMSKARTEFPDEFSAYQESADA